LFFISSENPKGNRCLDCPLLVPVPHCIFHKQFHKHNRHTKILNTSVDMNFKPVTTAHLLSLQFLRVLRGTRGSVVDWDTMLQAGRSRVRFPIRSLDFCNWLNPSSRPISLGSSKPLTEKNTRNLPGDKGWSACRALTSPPSVSRLSGKCESLDASQPCRTSRPVIGIALPLPEFYV
jgi:hypothetical protein